MNRKDKIREIHRKKKGRRIKLYRDVLRTQ